MEKTFKVHIPEGYEIDKKKSSFEEIVFKKKNFSIKWNKQLHGVEIEDGDERFVISGYPSYFMTPKQAKLFVTNESYRGSLPNYSQCTLISKYGEEINSLMRENKGYTLHFNILGCGKDGHFFIWSTALGESIIACMEDVPTPVRYIHNLKLN